MGYYHVDRTGSLVVGMKLSLFDDFDSPDWSIDGFGSMVKDLFPEGISKHGLQYLRPSAYPKEPLNDEEELRMRVLEQNFELCRRAAFPDCPSRFQSLFCVENISDLLAWPEILAPGFAIYEIETLPLGASTSRSPNRVPFRADAAYLAGGCFQTPEGNAQGRILMDYSLSRDYGNASRYWSGCASPHPKWEWVVPLPVRVAAKAATWDERGIRVF